MPLKGTVKSWVEARGFGHITEDGSDQDIFCHRSNLSGCEALAVGDKVEFEKEFNERKQKHEAKNVTGGTGKAASRGTVKTWIDAKGYGFIADDNAPEGEDKTEYFVHRSQLSPPQTWLDVGSKVTFTKHYDEAKQKTCAINVTQTSGNAYMDMAAMWGMYPPMPGMGYGWGMPGLGGYGGYGWGAGWNKGKGKGKY
eukprot:TRINITY_DN221_c2_g1_i1.p1 TRINITY_DN221_c2_g1~~TRINITY_DN221_c2_g1_i1.p1  ORF type:complete len:227 (+),score=57.43 TRINITY_DN221_c2_g1_i1:91-681(+)